MSNCLNYNTCYNARQFRHAASGRLRLGGKLLSSRKLSPADTIDQAVPLRAAATAGGPHRSGEHPRAMSSDSHNPAELALNRRGLVGALYDSVADLGAVVIRWVDMLDDIAWFTIRTFSWLLTRVPRRETLLPSFYNIGVLSLPVVALTGTFIGMVLAVQAYTQFRSFGFETRLGAMINLSMCRELGPVLAATMLAGRVGSAIAAELGTMRVTEQIDALVSMGANPIRYLVVPRFLACLLMIPSLTLMAIFMGIVGGGFYSVYVLGIDSYHYWSNSQEFVDNWDLFYGIFKSVFFGATIALVSCHRGFNCAAGAEGVGRAATASFVISFVVIIMLDLVLSIMLDTVHDSLWPQQQVSL
jgi:phospholipid/cholesterol/gamma-HCH transport system permease protein